MTDESSRYHRRRRSPSYSHRQPPRCSRLGRSRGAPQSYHRRRSHVVSDGSIRRSRLCIQSKMCTWSGRLPFHSVSIRLVGLKLSSIRGNSIILLCDRQRHGETWSSVITAHNNRLYISSSNHSFLDSSSIHGSNSRLTSDHNDTR